MNSEAKSFSGTRRRDESLNHQRNAWWDYVRRERTRRRSRFSAASPMMIFPPLLLVFSTESAVLRPCSCFPRPWPSLKPYFCMILWATVPLRGGKGRRELGIGIQVFYPQFKQESLNNDNELRLNARLTQPFAKGPANIDSYMQLFSLICLVLCILDWVVCFNANLDKSLH